MKTTDFERYGLWWRFTDTRPYNELGGMHRIAVVDPTDNEGNRVPFTSDAVSYRGREYPALSFEVYGYLRNGVYENVYAKSFHRDYWPEGLYRSACEMIKSAIQEPVGLTQEQRGSKLQASAELTGRNDGHQAVRSVSTHLYRPSDLYSREAWETFAKDAAQAYLDALLEHYSR